MERLRRDLGLRLAQFRTRLGLSQVQVARSVGVSHSTIGALERGERLPDKQLWSRVGEALGLSGRELDHQLNDIRTRHKRDAQVTNILAHNPALSWALSSLQQGHAYSREEWRPVVRALVRMELGRARDETAAEVL